jgi:hypothetical protein
MQNLIATIAASEIVIDPSFETTSGRDLEFAELVFVGGGDIINNNL